MQLRCVGTPTQLCAFSHGTTSDGIGGRLDDDVIPYLQEYIEELRLADEIGRRES